jgi:hypothetical protein
MAFPAAPTESGGAKLHFLTTDGNAAAGWFGVTEGSTGTGSNTVGFAAIATHVEGDAVAAPGGLNTTATDVPVVLVAGDDGTNAVPIQVDASGDLKVVLTAGTAEIGKLAAGTAAIGKLAANSGVDIGDVDVTSLIPGTAATNLGKAEDVAHSSGDVGVMSLAVRKATPADLSGADGDYEPLQLDNGRLWASTLVTGDALTALQLIDDPVVILGTATYTETTTSGSVVGVVRNDTLAALAGTDNEIAPLQVNASGALYAVLSAGTAEIGKLAAGTAAIGKLAANSGVDIGDVDIIGDALTALQLIDDPVAVLGTATYSETTTSGMIAGAVRNDALATLAGTDNEIAPLQVDEDGGLWTHPAAAPKGGCKGFYSNDLDQTEEDIAAAACTVYGLYAWNSTAAPLYLKIFNTNTVTVGSTTADFDLIVPANADSDGAGIVFPIPSVGWAFSTALTMAMTTGVGATDSGAPGANAGGVLVLYQD